MNHPEVIALYDEIIAAKVRLARARSEAIAVAAKYSDAKAHLTVAEEELKRLQTEWTQLATEKA